jgi:hypothetical protein
MSSRLEIVRPDAPFPNRYNDATADTQKFATTNFASLLPFLTKVSPKQ